MGSPPSPAEFASALGPALRRSAAIARSLEGRVANRPKPGEETPAKAALTIADTAAQEALLAALVERFPGVGVIAEERTPTVALFPNPGAGVVVIDPIDGTLRFYLEGTGPYAVMMGLAVHGIFEAALVALPREELYFAAVRGGGATRAHGEEGARSVRAARSGNRVFISHDLPGAAVESLLAHGFEVAPASGGAISVAPLVPGVRAGLRWVGSDPSGVSIRGRVGALISREAGALVRTETGEAFPLDLESHARALLVAGNEEDLQALREAVAALC